MAIYSEREIARIQIDAAIEHYEQEGFIAAITLAGAAEEILGALLREAGAEPSLDSLTKGAIRIQQLLYPEDADLSDGEGTGVTRASLAAYRDKLRKDFVHRANRARNALKHHTSESGDMIDIGDPKEEAQDMVNRATSNYWQLVQDQTPAMGRYLRSRLTRFRE